MQELEDFGHNVILVTVKTYPLEKFYNKEKTEGESIFRITLAPLFVPHPNVGSD